MIGIQKVAHWIPIRVDFMGMNAVIHSNENNPRPPLNRLACS